MIVELTGSGKVRESVLSLKQPHQEIMTAGDARILCSTLVNRIKSDAENALKISGEFTSLTEQMQKVLGDITSAENRLKDVFSS